MRRAVVVLVLVVVAAGAGWYFGYERGHHHTTTTTSTTSTSTTSTSSTVAVAACDPTMFTGTVTASQGEAGTAYVTVTLTSAMTTPCVAAGPPVVTLYGGAVDGEIDQTTVDGSFFANQTGVPSTSAPLTVAARGQLAFDLSYSEVSVGTSACTAVDHLTVALSSTSSAITVATPDVAPCGAPTPAVEVSPFFAPVG